MVVRVDTTNLSRGVDFSLIVHTEIEPEVVLYAFNSSSHTYEVLEFTLIKEGVFYKAISKAPYFNGFFLAKINSKSMVVKKIGHPTPHFVIGYKENYTIPYKLYDDAGTELKSNNLTKIIDGFYYCEIGYDVTVMETLKKRFIIKENLTKLDYGVTMGDTLIDDVELPDYLINVTLGDVELSDVELQNISTNATLPDVEITEY